MAAAERKLLPIAEYAQLRGVSTRTIRRRIAEGVLPAYRLGPRLIHVDPVEADAALMRRIPTCA